MSAALIGGSIAAPIAGGLIGNALASGDQEAAMKAIQQAQDIINSVNIPDPSTLQVVLKQLQSQGQLTPQLEAALTQQASTLNGWTPDQTNEAAQKGALQSLLDTGKMGLNASDRASLNDTRNQVAQQVHAQEQSVLQNLAQRGMGGSGNELAARLSAGQAGAQLASKQGDDLSSMASQRALQAISGAGQLGGQMTQADFGRQAQIAQAQNAINQFNTANQQNVGNTNVALQNQAQATNLGEKQRIADSNTGTQNQNQLYNKQVLVDDYNRRMQKAQAQAGLLTGVVAPMDMQNAQNTRSMWSGIGSAVGGGLGAANAAGGAKSQVVRPGGGTNGYPGGYTAQAE